MVHEDLGGKARKLCLTGHSTTRKVVVKRQADLTNKTLRMEHGEEKNMELQRLHMDRSVLAARTKVTGTPLLKIRFVTREGKIMQQ